MLNTHAINSFQFLGMCFALIAFTYCLVVSKGIKEEGYQYITKAFCH